MPISDSMSRVGGETYDISPTRDDFLSQIDKILPPVVDLFVCDSQHRYDTKSYTRLRTMKTHYYKGDGVVVSV